MGSGVPGTPVSRLIGVIAPLPEMLVESVT